MTKAKTVFCSAFLVAALGGTAQAQLVAVDDLYRVPYRALLVAEAPGVLGNDTIDGEPVADQGGNAELLDYPYYGFLSCESAPTFDLCPDGSFTYTPDPSFPGFDSFTYQVDVGGELAQATVTLSACNGGPTRFVCWQEAAYLATLGELGYSTFQEGFEDNADWGALREPATAPFVIHAGLRWESNHPDPPASNDLTTGTGPARTGNWGLYDPDHGYATGTPAECDITNPPVECLFHDGFTGTRETGETRLYGAGGHFTGLGPNLAMILDGGPPIGLGAVQVGTSQFFGVIDTAGFTSFRVEERDGKVGQIRLVFGDDFTFGKTPPDTIPPIVGKIDSVPGTGDGELTEGEATGVAIHQLLVTFSELVQDRGEAQPDSVTNPGNYLLFSDGGDGFDTVDCAAGVDAGDVAISTGPVTYVSGSERMAVLDVNDGVGLPPADYRLLVCGTTSIRDWAGNPLDGNENGIGGDDFERNFTVSGPTPAPGDVLDSVRVDKSAITPGSIRVSWAASCAAGALDYAIYEGTIGSYYSHDVSVVCTDTGGDLVEEVVPQSASSYYLVVPLGEAAEGSYGRDSNGVERPVATSVDRCLGAQVTGGCR